VQWGKNRDYVVANAVENSIKTFRREEHVVFMENVQINTINTRVR
jgi:hypothetical protein